MNRTIRKQIPLGAAADQSRNQEIRPTVSRRGVRRRSRGGRVCGQLRMCTVTLSATNSGELSMIVIKENSGQVSVEKGLASTVTGNFETMPSGPRPVTRQSSVAAYLLTSYVDGLLIRRLEALKFWMTCQ